MQQRWSSSELQVELQVEQRWSSSELQMELQVDTSGAAGGAAVSSGGGKLQEGADVDRSSVQGSADLEEAIARRVAAD